MRRVPDSRFTAPVVALTVGIALGVALRNAPVAVADLVVTSQADIDDRCGVEAAVDCAVRNMPEAIIEVARFGLAVLAIAAFFAVVGAAGAIWGWLRVRRVAAAADRIQSPAALAVLAIGIALVMPALWLAASFAAAVAG